MPGRIYDWEREYAIRENAAVQYVVQLGHVAAMIAARKLQNAVVEEWRQGGDYSTALARGLTGMRPILSDAVLYSRLKGMDRTIQVAEERNRSPELRLARRLKVPISVRQYRKGVELMTRRLNLSPSSLSRLRGQADAHVVRVLARVNQGAQKKLQETVAKGVERRWGVKRGVEELRKDFDKLGLTERNSFQLEAIFRTQTKLAYSAGQDQVAHDPDVASILWGYKYVTMRDERVRPNHRLLEGTTLPADDPAWLTITPPNGWACRCVRVMLFREHNPVQPLPGGGPDDGFDFSPSALFRPVR